MGTIRDLTDDELIDAAMHLEGRDDQQVIDLERWRRDRATAKEQAEDARVKRQEESPFCDMRIPHPSEHLMAGQR